MAHQTLQPIDPVLEERRRERLRSNVPAAAAVVMLLGVILAGALALERLVNLGVWLIGTTG
ncbi:MAG: hypothetical protein GX609_00915 [Actinomycetales bacterium]|jgi:hypothetical protein|nr:hypothetical protein [Actinomycetales bacterium]